MHCAFEITVTFTARSLGDWEPPEEVVPQPVTVASFPVYSDVTSAGRHTGAMTWLKVIGELRVRMETS